MDRLVCINDTANPFESGKRLLAGNIRGSNKQP